jgi:hypothetical protein
MDDDEIGLYVGNAFIKMGLIGKNDLRGPL